MKLLEDGVAAKTIVKHPQESVYAGFAVYHDLKSSDCQFVPMNSNRVINTEVVEMRVDANLKAYRDLGRYLDFGEISLLVLRTSPKRDFFVMDGQHRTATMEKLYSKHRDVPLVFHFRVVVVTTEAEAHEHLIHFQDCYPADPRAFFETQHQTKLAGEVVDELHRRWPGAFRERVKVRARMGGGHTSDPPRPYLNDYVTFWLLKQSGLLVAPNAAEGTVVERLDAMNALLRTAPLRSLGDAATEHMRGIAVGTCGGCFLGFFRESKLEWGALATALANSSPPPPRAALPPPSAAPATLPAPAALPAPPAMPPAAGIVQRKRPRDSSDGTADAGAESAAKTEAAAGSASSAPAVAGGAGGADDDARMELLVKKIRLAEQLGDVAMVERLKRKLEEW